MEILLITGKLAKESVQRFAKQASAGISVLDLPVPVASLLTPEFIAQYLKGIDLAKFDVIIVPGLIRGDVTLIERTYRVPTFKGPKYAADIPLVLYK